ncbi:uncharacterized protein V6R79_006805 [Siganus canaliculatus]
MTPSSPQTTWSLVSALGQDQDVQTWWSNQLNSFVVPSGRAFSTVPFRLSNVIFPTIIKRLLVSGDTLSALIRQFCLWTKSFSDGQTRRELPSSSSSSSSSYTCPGPDQSGSASD